MSQLQSEISRQIVPIDINEEPVLNISKRIRVAYKTRGHASFFAGGFPGSGKSRLALHVLYDVYGDWDKVKQFFFFERTVDDFRMKLDALYRKYGLIPLVVMDDVGTWFMKYSWQQKRSQNTFKLLNLVRNVAAGILATAIEREDIVKYLRDKFRWKLLLEPMYDVMNPDIPQYARWISAKGYEIKTNPDDSTWVEWAIHDTFNLWIPPDIQEWEWNHRMEVVEWIQKEEGDEKVLSKADRRKMKDAKRVMDHHQAQELIARLKTVRKA